VTTGQETTRLPVRSALFKQRTGGLVVRWVTTSEYPLLYVFGSLFGTDNFSFHSLTRQMVSKGLLWNNGIVKRCAKLLKELAELNSSTLNQASRASNHGFRFAGKRFVTQLFSTMLEKSEIKTFYQDETSHPLVVLPMTFKD
jgi:hypothetical protein